jgi:N-acetylneuraminic acid mutarotase
MLNAASSAKFTVVSHALLPDLPVVLRRSANLLVVLAGLSTASCGGGGDGAPPPPSRYFLDIAIPTWNDSYETKRNTVVLEGRAFVPDGAECTGIVGTMPPGYSVRWSNSTTGHSLSANFYLGCLLQVKVIWETGAIPLEVGTNAITVTARDAAGNTASDTLYVTRIADNTPPVVVSVFPASGAIDVSVNTSVVVTFSEEMEPTTINTGTIILRDGSGNLVPASVTHDNDVLNAYLSPTRVLISSTTYEVTVTEGVKDVVGNSLAAPFVSYFATAIDTTPPSVQSVYPSSGSMCASPGANVSASFSEAIDPATVNTTSFTLTGPGNQAVLGTVSSGIQTASFDPSAALPFSTQFTATLTTGIKDLAGNSLASPFQWSFITASPAAGSWTPTSLAGAPTARSGHVAVWTGGEMIVSGGGPYTDQYGRYNPTTQAWTLGRGAPPYAGQGAVWTGSKMLVWGGHSGGVSITGGAAFDPTANSWSPISTTNEPSARYNHTAVWTGSEMIIWGGTNSTGSYFRDGGRYNPVSDSWQPISTVGAPSARAYHTAVWTGSAMIVWGGSAPNQSFADGARYDPVTDSWTPISAAGAPSAWYGHVAVWTGNEMIIWGGQTNIGGRYDPATDSWRATDSSCAPWIRQSPAVVWTGSRMVFWGGKSVTGTLLADGYEYDPAGDSWQSVTVTGQPSARYLHTAVWTGSEVIFWGGADSGAPMNSGGLLTP